MRQEHGLSGRLQYLARADEIHSVLVVRLDSHMYAAPVVHTVQHCRQVTLPYLLNDLKVSN